MIREALMEGISRYFLSLVWIFVDFRGCCHAEDVEVGLKKVCESFEWKIVDCFPLNPEYEEQKCGKTWKTTHDFSRNSTNIQNTEISSVD
jgi:hypothetical protein